MPTPSRRAGIVFVALLVFAVSTDGQDREDSSLPRGFSEPMPLFSKALGEFTRPISSADQEARSYFDQGFQMMYAFAKQDAIRSFREASKRDPDCAICYWGEAWSWGFVSEWTDAAE